MAGRFIAFEGIDGSGKSTQLRHLQRRMEEAGIPVLSTTEPTQGPIGRLIRQILSGEVRTDERVIAPLYVADRTDHLLNPDWGVCGALSRGVNVLMDRYYFSSYAYQTTDSVPMERIIAANADCAATLRPDLTVFLDLSPEEAMRRIAAGRDRREIFENLERLKRVRDNYLEAFRRMEAVERVVILDAAEGEAALAERIWSSVAPLFPQKD